MKPRAGESAPCGLPGQFHLDGAVVKRWALDERVGLGIRDLAVFCDFYGAFAEILDAFQLHHMRRQLVDALCAQSARDKEKAWKDWGARSRKSPHVFCRERVHDHSLFMPDAM